jgi:acetyl esterase/lipase
MKLEKITHLYKTVKDCEIRADAYPCEPSCPAIIWIHGGALISGNRGGIREEQLELYHRSGYAVISIDYRLAPETKLPEIIEDLRDAISWVRERGPELVGIDPRRVATMGHSAGGYLTLMSGFCVDPPPSALVSFYGYGDLTGDWYSRPDPFYCRQPLVSRDEAHEAVGERAISEDLGAGDRGRYYLYLRQRGLWPNEVSGFDPRLEPRAFDPYEPVRNVGKDYPPTLLLHGDGDTDVPYQQSVMMAEALEDGGIEHELVTIRGGGHGFDGLGLDDSIVAGAFDKVIGFLDGHLG